MKPLEQMTVEELQDACADWMNGDLVHIDGTRVFIDPFNVVDELVRRNKLLVEALDESEEYWSRGNPRLIDLCKSAQAAAKETKE